MSLRTRGSGLYWVLCWIFWASAVPPASSADIRVVNRAICDVTAKPPAKIERE